MTVLEKESIIHVRSQNFDSWKWRPKAKMVLAVGKEGVAFARIQKQITREFRTQNFLSIYQSTFLRA